MEKRVIYRAYIQNGSVHFRFGFEEPLILLDKDYEVLGKVSGRYLDAQQRIVGRNEEEMAEIVLKQFPEANMVAFKLSRFPPRSNQFTAETGSVIKVSAPNILRILEEGVKKL